MRQHEFISENFAVFGTATSSRFFGSKLEIWRTQSHSAPRKLSVPSVTRDSKFALSSNGKYLAIATNKQIQIHNADRRLPPWKKVYGDMPTKHPIRVYFSLDDQTIGCIYERETYFESVTLSFLNRSAPEFRKKLNFKSFKARSKFLSLIWSPTGTHIALQVVHRDQVTVFVVHRDSDIEERVIRLSRCNSPVEAPALLFAFGTSWFVVDLISHKNFGIRLVDLSTGAVVRTISSDIPGPLSSPSDRYFWAVAPIGDPSTLSPETARFRFAIGSRTKDSKYGGDFVCAVKVWNDSFTEVRTTPKIKRCDIQDFFLSTDGRSLWVWYYFTSKETGDTYGADDVYHLGSD